MSRTEMKEVVRDALVTDDVKYMMEHVDSTPQLYIVCKNHLHGISEAEFYDLMCELIQEGAPCVGEDLQEIATSVKVGQIYVEL